MPEISRFYGIIVRMFYNEHGTPHVHVLYAGTEAKVSRKPVAITKGRLPQRARGLIVKWASSHRFELLRNWDLARAGLPLLPIPLLR